MVNYSAAYSTLLREIEATSGQLRYDPITLSSFKSMDEKEYSMALIKLEDMLMHTNDERIPVVLSKISPDKTVKILLELIQNGNKPAAWNLSAYYSIYLVTKDADCLQSMLGYLKNESMPVGIKTAVFSYLLRLPKDKFISSILESNKDLIVTESMELRIDDYLNSVNLNSN